MKILFLRHFIMYWILLFIPIGIIWYIMHRKSSKLRKDDAKKKYNHAIILGGSIAGMTTAAYLSKYFQKITIIESDDVLNDLLMNSTPEQLLDYRCNLKNSNSIGRSGVSQNYQIHVLQGEGSRILFHLFPHLKSKLMNEYGAHISSLKAHFRFTIGNILLNRNLTEDLSWFCIDRFTLETILRRELCLQFPIQWICNTRVIQLIVNQRNNSVQGVQCRRGKEHSIEFYGDLIVDCMGRHTSAIKWLKQNLNLIIPTEELHTGTGYVSFIGERLKTGNSSIDAFHTGGHAVHAPDYNKGFLTTPIRQMKTSDANSLGLLSNFAVYCVNGEYPPHDCYENLLEWVKEYLPMEYYLILKSTTLLSPLLPYRRAFDHRKYVEFLGKKWPRNYILLGDSMCVFNPKNGQGMTHACRQARELNQIFEENVPLKDISHIYNTRASLISEECWLGSITNDWAVPTLKLIQTDEYGRRKTYQRSEDSTSIYPQPKIPLFMQFLQWYTYWLIQCAGQSGELTTAFIHVVFQEKSPYSLLKPKFVSKILYSSIIHYLNLPKKIFD